MRHVITVTHIAKCIREIAEALCNVSLSAIPLAGMLQFAQSIDYRN